MRSNLVRQWSGRHVFYYYCAQRNTPAIRVDPSSDKNAENPFVELVCRIMRGDGCIFGRGISQRVGRCHVSNCINFRPPPFRPAVRPFWRRCGREEILHAMARYWRIVRCYCHDFCRVTTVAFNLLYPARYPSIFGRITRWLAARWKCQSCRGNGLYAGFHYGTSSSAFVCWALRWRYVSH